MEDRVKGAWIVHHATKIEEHGGADGLDSLRKAGNCGMLLSALRATQQSQVEMQKVKTLAQVAGIDLTYQLPALLLTLKEHALIDYNDAAVEVLGLTTRNVLEHTSKIFEAVSPRPTEEATLDIAELCSAAPRTDAELRTYVGDTHKLSAKEAGRLMKTVEKVRFCDAEILDKSTTVYFNGSLFKSDGLRKAKAVLDSLSSTEQVRIGEVDQKLTAEGCIEKPQAVQMLGEALFKKLHSIGLYDVNTVSNAAETIEYITKPAAFNKFGRSDVADAFDLAKAFVASLQYGMTRSHAGRGRIALLQRLMQKLIRGEVTRPCTAAGEDYQLLEMRGVVQVIPAGFGMYSMKLLKRDVGELALEVLKTGDASEKSLDSLPDSPLSNFRGPEPNRVQARVQARKQNIDVRQALETLRTRSI
jgi:hypothetical protein